MLQFDSRKGPLYQQLADWVILQILQGQLKAGDKLPSARELAVSVGLNPNTVIQAFQHLEKLEISETKRGKGTFVRMGINIDSLRQKKIELITKNYLEDVQALGLQPEDVVHLIKKMKQIK